VLQDFVSDQGILFQQQQAANPLIFSPSPVFSSHMSRLFPSRWLPTISNPLVEIVKNLMANPSWYNDNITLVDRGLAVFATKAFP